MNQTDELRAAIEAARQDVHASVERSFDALLQRLIPEAKTPTGGVNFNDPTDEHCRDPRNKNGHNLTPEGVEILFRLLDQGAGYNSAGRKMSVTQTAVKNRKKDWEAAGGLKRKKLFVSFLDTRK
ncbi:hypothetical protein [Azorhizobium sp. AG788]|uniref:hypothetical protein n=1 Tax=Azorhizobium sp. AG788 TaxID=2183897 RepID=UPI003138A2B6